MWAAPPTGTATLDVGLPQPPSAHRNRPCLRQAILRQSKSDTLHSPGQGVCGCAKSKPVFKASTGRSLTGIGVGVDACVAPAGLGTRGTDDPGRRSPAGSLALGYDAAALQATHADLVCRPFRAQTAGG